MSDNIGLLPTQYNYSSEPLWTQVTEREELPDQATRRPGDQASRAAQPRCRTDQRSPDRVGTSGRACVLL